MSWAYSVMNAWQNLWNKAVVPATNAIMPDTNGGGGGVAPIAPTLDDIVITGIDRTPQNDSIEAEKKRRLYISLAIAGVALGGIILIASRRK